MDKKPRGTRKRPLVITVIAIIDLLTGLAVLSIFLLIGLTSMTKSRSDTVSGLLCILVAPLGSVWIFMNAWGLYTLKPWAYHVLKINASNSLWPQYWLVTRFGKRLDDEDVLAAFDLENARAKLANEEKLTIRRFEPDDADALSRLIVDDLTLVNVRDYGAYAVGELARFYSPPALVEYAKNGEIYVAVERAAIVGTATLEQDRVRNVFVRMDRHGGGIGKLLMRHIEEAALRQGQARLVLQANLAAVDFYRKLGYRPVRDTEESIGDARVKMVVMEKMLQKGAYDAR